MAKEPINLLVTVDKNYIMPLSVMLSSYGKLHKDGQTELYILHSSLNEEDIEVLRESTNGFNINIHSIFVSEKWFEDTPVLERLPEESFYRLAAFELLPKNIDRILYLDPDIIIRKELYELYKEDIEDCYIAASSHTHKFKNKVNLFRLGISEHEKYINSGVMLMNLSKIREDFSIEGILKVLDENLQRLLLGDQDLINILFGEKMKIVDERIYNLDERTLRHYRKSFGIDDAKEKTAIVHYNGKYKPWLEGYKGELDKFYPEVDKKGPAPKGKNKGVLRSVFYIIGRTKQQRVLLISILAGLIFCVTCWIAFGRELLGIIKEPEGFRAWLDNFGVFDEAAFVLIRTVQTVIKFIPAEPLEIGSGYAWGAIPGMLYCVVGNLFGTLIILAFTKRFGKAFTECFLTPKSIDSLTKFSNSDKIYALLFFLYLIPGLPKDGFTYIVGLMQVKAVPFLIITFVARMPSVLSSTVCGATLYNRQYLFSALIFGGTVLLAIIGTVLYRKYSKKKLAEAAQK